jgi:hypothetical protein
MDAVILLARDRVGSEIQGPRKRGSAVVVSAWMVYGQHVEGMAKIGDRVTASYLVTAGTERIGNHRDGILIEDTG